MKGVVILNRKEQSRLVVLNQMEMGIEMGDSEVKVYYTIPMPLDSDSEAPLGALPYHNHK